jgi:hypothetical protein
MKPDKSLDLRSRFGTIAIFKDPDPTDDTKARERWESSSNEISTPEGLSVFRKEE